MLFFSPIYWCSITIFFTSLLAKNPYMNQSKEVSIDWIFARKWFICASFFWPQIQSKWNLNNFCLNNCQFNHVKWLLHKNCKKHFVCQLHTRGTLKICNLGCVMQENHVIQRYVKFVIMLIQFAAENERWKFKSIRQNNHNRMPCHFCHSRATYFGFFSAQLFCIHNENCMTLLLTYKTTN